MNPTTVHSSEVVGQLVLIEADPIRQRVRHAMVRVALQALAAVMGGTQSLHSNSYEPESGYHSSPSRRSICRLEGRL